MKSNYVPISRQILEHDIWLMERFTYGQAWVDLILLANHKKNMTMVRGISLLVERGQVARSQESIAKRWKWERKKVRRFLDFLSQQNMIKVGQQKNHITSIIELINYDKWNKLGTTEGTTESGQNLSHDIINMSKMVQQNNSVIPIELKQNTNINGQQKVQQTPQQKVQQKGHKQEGKECKKEHLTPTPSLDATATARVNGWTTKAGQIWTTHQGVANYGEIGRHLKLVVAEVGEEECLRRFEIYCKSDKCFSPAHFAKHHKTINANPTEYVPPHRRPKVREVLTACENPTKSKEIG